MKALITGITGQDGSYLAELLLSKGYEVFGVNRRSSMSNTSRIDHILDQITLISADMTDQKSLISAIEQSQPDEVYNLAAQSFVKASWSQAEYTMNTNGLGCVRMLEAIRQIKPDAKFYQASTSECFGKVREVPQTEKTQFYPRSPYAVSKVAAYWATVNYRESYNIFACNGLLFNHESERRGLEFVTRKITHGVAQIIKGKADYITLGNLDAKRDWGYSPDFCLAMYLMLQQKESDDYVVATGVEHSVEDFVAAAFKAVEITNWRSHVKQDERFMRPADVESLCGDATKAKEKLGWVPETSFEEMVKKMVMYDVNN